MIGMPTESPSRLLVRAMRDLEKRARRRAKWEMARLIALILLPPVVLGFILLAWLGN